jgi:hypothetical protein
MYGAMQGAVRPGDLAKENIQSVDQKWPALKASGFDEAIGA